MNSRNWFLLDTLLKVNNSYLYEEKIDKNAEIKKFLIGLFELTDEFNTRIKQQDSQTLKAHLQEV